MSSTDVVTTPVAHDRDRYMSEFECRACGVRFSDPGWIPGTGYAGGELVARTTARPFTLHACHDTERQGVAEVVSWKLNGPNPTAVRELPASR